jgi:hypothetical protein
VTYDSTAGDADIIGIDADGMLRFSTAQSTRLRVGTLLVLPNGTLEVGTSANPIPASFTAEIIIKNKALSPSADPDQFGTGLLSIDRKVTMFGAVKTPTFVRTAVEPRAGQTVIQLERVVSGWRVGDRLFIPDSRQVDENNKFNSNYLLQIDEVTVQSVSADGRSITVSPALRYDHRGARDANGTPTVLNDGTKFLPHVGNLTRNVIVRSESPSGTRGHTLFTQRAGIPDPPGIKVTMLNNVVSPWPGQPLRTIGMDYNAAGFTNKKYEIFVYDYQGQAGNNFRVYWREQATQNIAGGLAPCNDTTSRPEIDGITCPMTGPAVTIPNAPSGFIVQ